MKSHKDILWSCNMLTVLVTNESLYKICLVLNTYDSSDFCLQACCARDWDIALREEFDIPLQKKIYIEVVV